MMTRHRGVVGAAVSCLAMAAAVVALSPAGVTVAESPGCAHLNDPASGFNVQSTGASVSGMEFNPNDQIFVTGAEPTFGDARGIILTLDGIDGEKYGLRATALVWIDPGRSLTRDLSWSVLLDDEVPDETAEVTWTVECVPGPELLSAHTTCSEDDGVITVSIHDPELRSYVIFIYPVELHDPDDSDRFEVDVTDPSPNSFEFEPYPNDQYQVVIEPADNLSLEFLITSVTVACPATTPTSTTNPPTTEPSPTTGNSLPPTGTSGHANATLMVAAILLIATGSALLIARRRLD